MTRGMTTFILLMLAATFARADEVEIKQADDRSVTVTGGTYVARIDPTGNLVELSVGGVDSIHHTFEPAAGKPTVNVVGNLVAVRSGKARIEYTFKPKTIHVECEGYRIAGTVVGKNITAVLAPGGKGGPYPRKGGRGYGQTTGVVLTGGKTVKYTEPFHVTGDKRYVLSRALRRRYKTGQLLTFDMTLGEPAGAAAYLGPVVIGGVGNNYDSLKAPNRAGYGLVHFSDPAAVTLSSHQANGGEDDQSIAYELVLENHYVLPKVVHRDTQDAVVAAGKSLQLTWSIPKLEPGFYYATVIARQKDEELTRSQLYFAVDLSTYSRPTTRPEDFEAFWKAKLAAMRAVPFDAELTEMKELGSEEVVHYRLDITMVGSKTLAAAAAEIKQPGVKDLGKTAPGDDTLHLVRFRSALRLPRKPGRYTAKIFGRARLEELDTDLVHIQLSARDPLYNEFKFRRWTSRDDNNMLDSVLAFVRLCDYLRSRDEVKDIYLWGASRTGPLVYLAAALDGRQIAGVASMVPTDCGIGWTDLPYRGWGMPRIAFNKPELAAKQVKQFATVGAYFDPVNFARDMTVPVVFGYGIKDNLAPPPGIEATYHLTASTWKRISRDGCGHQYSPGYKALVGELERHIGIREADGDTDILKEH